MIWFTSDQHFFHRNIIKLSKRPFKDTAEMHETYIKNWNARVKKRDTVYVLGDFSFGGFDQTKYILTRLNGCKILVWGNHDKTPKRMLEMGFEQVYENFYITLQPGNVRVYLSHFPYYSWKSALKAQIFGWSQWSKYAHKRMVSQGYWLLHGHTHSKGRVDFRKRMIHVGVDAWDGKPIPHTTILNIIARRRKWSLSGTLTAVMKRFWRSWNRFLKIKKSSS